MIILQFLELLSLWLKWWDIISISRKVSRLCVFSLLTHFLWATIRIRSRSQEPGPLPLGATVFFNSRSFCVNHPPAFFLISSQPGCVPGDRSGLNDHRQSSGANWPQPPPGWGGVNNQSQTRIGNTNQSRVIPLESVNLSSIQSRKIESSSSSVTIRWFPSATEIIQNFVWKYHHYSEYFVFFNKSTFDYRWQKDRPNYIIQSYLRNLLREEKFVEVIMTQFVEAGPSFQLQDLILAPNTLSQCHFYLTNWFPTKVHCHYILNIYKTLKIIYNNS